MSGKRPSIQQSVARSKKPILLSGDRVSINLTSVDNANTVHLQ